MNIGKPRLLPTWRAELNRAWSVRTSFLGAAFAGAGMALPALSDWFSHKWFFALCIVCSLGTVWAKVLDQKPPGGDSDAG